MSPPNEILLRSGSRSDVIKCVVEIIRHHVAEAALYFEPKPARTSPDQAFECEDFRETTGVLWENRRMKVEGAGDGHDLIGFCFGDLDPRIGIRVSHDADIRWCRIGCEGGMQTPLLGQLIPQSSQ